MVIMTVERSLLTKIMLSASVSAFGLVLGLAAVELAFRIFQSQSQPATQWTDRPAFYFQAEESPTLKDYAYAEQKPPHTFRVAVVGDSYTFAPYMQFTDAFPKVLERMLNLNAVETRAEVINFGVPGYSTNHEIEEVDRAIAMQSDLVVLQITLNDPELKPYRPTGIREFGSFGAYEPRGFIGRLGKHWKSLGFAIERLHNNKTADEYQKYFLKLFEERRSREAFEGAVTEIARKCKAANVPLVAVVFPLFGLPLDDSYPFHPIHHRVDAFLKKGDVASLDLFELFKGIPLDRLQVIPGGDRHPNEIAHRMAAERIYTYLAHNDRVPSELKIKKRFEGRTQIIKERPYTDPVPSRP